MRNRIHHNEHCEFVHRLYSECARAITVVMLRLWDDTLYNIKKCSSSNSMDLLLWYWTSRSCSGRSRLWTNLQTQSSFCIRMRTPPRLVNIYYYLMHFFRFRELESKRYDRYTRSARLWVRCTPFVWFFERSIKIFVLTPHTQHREHTERRRCNIIILLLTAERV